MKKILLVLLLFASSYATAQTLTVSGTTYNIVSGELLDTANAYTRGFIVGRAANLGVTCENTSLELSLRPGSTGIQLGTYIRNAAPQATVVSVVWRHLRWNTITRRMEVIDVSDRASDRGDIDFGYVNDHQLTRSRLDPVDGSVQSGDIIEAVYIDTCGVYIAQYEVPTSSPALVSGGRTKPPKIRRPITVG